jgi:hypothetical protein
MKNKYERFKRESDSMTIYDVNEGVKQLTRDIIKTDPRLISVDKRWIGYSTWRSRGWANKAEFGEPLAKAIEKALTGRITHDEEMEFKIEDFSEAISDEIFEDIIHN